MSKRATILGIIAITAITFRADAANDCTRPKNVVIDAAVTRARVPIAVRALQSNIELVLRNIRFDTHPGTQFNVILERRGDPAKRERVGTLSFYTSTKARVTTSRTFDVTDELRKIASATDDLREVDVVFEATTGRGGTNTKTTVAPRSKLTIGEIELRVKK